MHWAAEERIGKHLCKQISKHGIKKSLTKSEFVNDLCAIWNTGMKRVSIFSGFEGTGIVLKIINVISVYNISIKS